MKTTIVLTFYEIVWSVIVFFIYLWKDISRAQVKRDRKE